MWMTQKNIIATTQKYDRCSNVFQLIPNLTTRGSLGRRRKWRVPQWTLPSQRSLRVPWQPQSLRVQNPSDKTSNTTTCHNHWKLSTWTMYINMEGNDQTTCKEGRNYTQSLKVRSIEVYTWKMMEVQLS